MLPALSLHQHESDRCILNHDILSCTHEGVAGNHLYSGRALGLSHPQDLIQIHPFLKREWNAISEHYSRVGLSHSKNVVWDTSVQTLEAYPQLQASVFFFGHAEHRARPNNSWYRVVDHINSKNNFVALASHLRMDVPQTLCFHGKQWFAGIDHFPYPCYVKAAVSVAGKGIHRCENKKDVIQALAYFDEDVPIQVQEEVSAKNFLNLQYQATDRGLQRVIVTEQLLDGFTHQGNRHPASYEPWDSVEPMAKWLLEKGMQGVFAFDVAVLESDHEVRFMPIECNPRFNGATYPSAIAFKLQISQWMAKEFVTRYRQLSEIDLTGIEFDAKSGTGVILVNWGTVLVGKLGVLIAGSEVEQERIASLLVQRL